MLLYLIVSSTLLLLWYGRSLLVKGAGATYGLVSKIRLPQRVAKFAKSIAGTVIEHILFGAMVACLTLCLAGYLPDPSPTPPPGPGPGPKPIVVEEGPRTIVIVRESSDDNPAFGRMTVNLRWGEHAQEVEGAGHKLIVLDDDETNENGEPLTLLRNLLPLNQRLPALFILDDKAKVLYHETLTLDDNSADHVIEVLQQHGG